MQEPLWCERRPCSSSSQILVMQKRLIFKKFSVKRTISFAASSRGRGAGFFLLPGFKAPNKKQHSARETMKSLQKFVPPDQKPGIILPNSSVGGARVCVDVCWNHDKSTPCRPETNGIAENAVRRVKEGTSAPLVQPCLPEKRWREAMLVLFSKRTRQIGKQHVTV